MARQIIAKTKCAFCKKPFEIATEDLEWENISNCGETNENPNLKDFAISQKINCPHCNKGNKILIEIKGKNEVDLDLGSIKVINFSEIQNSINP